MMLSSANILSEFLVILRKRTITEVLTILLLLTLAVGLVIYFNYNNQQFEQSYIKQYIDLKTEK